MILLTSEDFVKGLTNIDDNLQASYLTPAIREAQETELESVLGSALVGRLCELVSTGDIDLPENVKYKQLLDKSQYFIAYSAIKKVVVISSFKISNFGISQADDEHIKALSLDDVIQIQDIYQKKADFYCGRLQEWIKDNASYFPELSGNLTSAATTPVFLGGKRGKRSSCNCGHSHSASGGSGGGGTVVGWHQLLTGGTKIAEIAIDGTRQDVYAPEGSQGGVTPEDVDEKISEAMNQETARTESTYLKEHQSLDDYYDKDETDELLSGKQDALTAGSGISIDDNVISCTVSGGGESNYVIVDNLSAITEPFEGLRAYVREHMTYETMTGYTMNRNDEPEGYVAHISINGEGNKDVYQSGDNFYWDWNNDGNWHTKAFDGGMTAKYRKTENPLNFTFVASGEGWTYVFDDNISYSAETSVTFGYLIKGDAYIYKDNGWKIENDNLYYDVNDLGSQSVRKEIVDNANNGKVVTVMGNSGRMYHLQKIENLGEDIILAGDYVYWSNNEYLRPRRMYMRVSVASAEYYEAETDGCVIQRYLYETNPSAKMDDVRSGKICYSKGTFSGGTEVVNGNGYHTLWFNVPDFGSSEEQRFSSVSTGKNYALNYWSNNDIWLWIENVGEYWINRDTVSIGEIMTDFGRTKENFLGISYSDDTDLSMESHRTGSVFSVLPDYVDGYFEVYDQGEWHRTDNGKVKSDSINRIITLTQEEYDALEDKDNSVLYVITQ